MGGMTELRSGIHRCAVMPRFAAALLILSVVLAPVPSQAIEIFGFKFFEPEEEDTLPVVDPLNYSVTLQAPGAPEELLDRLNAASALVEGEDEPVSGSIGLIQRATSDFETLVGVLYEDARYGGVVDITLAGQPLAALPPDTELSGPVPVAITVTPGPVFAFGRTAIDGTDADPQLYGLVPGLPARSVDILQAENRLTDDLRAEGRAFARIGSRDVVADHDRNLLDVRLTVEPGPVAAFGATDVEGAELVDEDFIAYMADVPPGETYDPDTLEAAERRLKSLEVFNSVTVRGADEPGPGNTVPVTANVTERKMRYFGVGATYSSTEGGGLEGYWGHRNLFGRAEKLRIEGSVAGLGETSAAEDFSYRGAILFEKPGVLGPPSRFVSRLEIAQENPDAYRRFSVDVSAGIIYEPTETQEVSVALEAEYARITDPFAVSRDTLTFALPLGWTWDRRDDQLNPTEGTRLALLLEPAVEIEQQAFFVKVRAEASGYRALDEENRFVLAGRVAAGSIFGAPLSDVPANRRFFAGGGGSVRGYAAQGIGPRTINGIPTGGLSFGEASAELRIEVTERIGIVPFIDAGLVSADSTFGNADIKFGAGVGLRYLTPFGPLRLDAAVPLNKGPYDPDFGIYAGIGQAF